MGDVDEKKQELALVAKARGGDRDAFSELVHRHKDSILALVFRQLGNHSLAEDLTQDVFIRAYSKLPTFQEQARFRTWLFRIALNVVHSHFESRAARNERRNLSFDTSVHERFMSRKDECFAAEDLQLIRQLLTLLDRKFREAVVLVIVEGWTHAEAANLLNIPQGTLSTRVRMGIELLKANFKRRSA